MSDSLWNLARDIRYSLRALRKTPAFTAGAIATVALTVGATTAIFSVVYGVLLRQLPYRQVEQVYWIWSDQPGRDRSPLNVPDFIDYRDSTRTLSGFAGYFAYSANLSDEAAAELVPGIRATGNLFEVIGAHARTGRLLRASDEQPGAEQVVVLAEPFWIRRFGGDSAIVGRSIRLNGEQYAVVGVLAAGFVTPIRDVDFVLPFAPDRDPRRGSRNSLNFIHGVGRLLDGVSQAQAASELNVMAQRLRDQYPVENARKRGIRMVALIDGIAGPFRTALLTLFAAVGAVLLIACANLANLMLTRAASRRKDLAVQLALGSSRANVVRHVLIEASLLGVLGGLLGVLMARWGVLALVALAPTALPRSGEIRLDLAVLAFSLVVSVLTGVLFGVIPAFASSRVDVREALQGSNRGTTAGGQRVRGALVSSEVALAVVLLIGMALLAKSFAKVQSVSPGFDSTRVLSARVMLPVKRFNNREALVTFQRALTQQLSTYSTVAETGAITPLPLSGLVWRVPFTVEGRFVERERVPLAQFRAVSPGFFEAARIPLKRGRAFSDRDTDRTRPVAVVNEELANRWLTGLEPVGARLLINDNEEGPRPVEVIGVIGNVQQISLDGDPTLDLYLPYPQIHRDNVEVAATNMFWIVRTTGDPMNFAPSLAREVRRNDPEVAASQMRPLDDYLSGAMAPRRFSLSLMVVFGLAALVLALTGIYAVVMYSASQRAHEIGIRVALGASPANIVRLVMRHGLSSVLIGLFAGIVVAVGTTRLMATMLFGVAATDPLTFVQVSFVVAAASLLASAVPTWQIHSANPRSSLGGSE
jgi:putative ABC transport system permease protein